MSFFWHDVRDAWRALIRSRGYSVVIVLTLGLGIGLNTAIFTVVDALLLKPLPYHEPERLVRVAEWPRTGGNSTVAPAAFVAWRTQQRSFTHFEARVAGSLTLLDGEAAWPLQGARVTAGYFEMLGVHPALGRTFAREEAQPGAPCTAVVSHQLWTARLVPGGASLGTPLRLSEGTCEIIGVLPPDSAFDRGPMDVFLPLAFSEDAAQNHGRFLTVLARLRAGVPIEQARAEMAALAAAFNARRGSAGTGWSTAITPLRDVVIRADSRALAVALFGAVALVLVVACLNVAGLSLSRTTARRREVGIRTALGASRWRVFRSLLVESLLLALAGGVVGLLLGSWGLRVFTSLAPPNTLPPEMVAVLDARALLFTALLSIVTGLVLGTVPALRGTAADPVDVLGAGGRTAASSRFSTSLHATLLVAELAMALVLVIAAISLVTSFVRLVRVQPGFVADDVLTMRLEAPAGRYASAEAVAGFYDDVLSAFRRVPGVHHAGAATSLPLGGWLFGTRFEVHGTPGDPERPASAHIQHTTDGYFEALGIPLMAGRSFTPGDGQRGPLVAIVNDTFARRFLPDGSAIGRQLRLGISPPRGDGVLWEIVGVVGDVKTGGLADAELATPEIYVPHRQSPMPALFVAIRTAPDSAAMVMPALRAALRSVDPYVPISAVMSMDERLGGSVRRERFRTAMIGASAGLALLLSALGVYAIRSQALAARVREIGIRLALGATRRQLITMVLGQAAKQIVLGIAIGLVVAVPALRVIEAWLFATTAGDPRILTGAAALLATAALAATWLPARRAAAIDPLSLLREE